jgi:hypothetical protein
MIDYDLGTFIRQIWSLLGNIDLLVRKIVKEEMGYKFIYIRRQFINIHRVHGAHEARLGHELVAPRQPRFEFP